MYQYKPTFTACYDQYAGYNGQVFDVVRVIDEPDFDHDWEVLPMFVIRFPNGHKIDAWPEEVLE